MQIVTSRLVLREYQEGDFAVLRELDSDPEVIRYEHAAYPAEVTRARLNAVLADRASHTGGRYRLAITIPPHDLLRGRISLSLNNTDIREYEIGWTLQRQEWGQGYATEAARAVMGFAFNDLHAHRIVAFCHADNSASRRVMVRLGMSCEGRLRQTRWLNAAWCDEWVYAILEEEFNA